MCLALIAVAAHPRFCVVLAANRDERYARAAAPADWWPDGTPSGGILAGRDLSGRGTWLGVDRRGRYAFVTNVRDPSRHDPAAPTRGTLVPRVLADPASVAIAVASAKADGATLNGFNLLSGDLQGAAWGSNRSDDVVGLAPGVHGVSNASLDTPWPKLVRTRAGLARWLGSGDDSPEPLFRVLGDRTRAPDDALPRTGVTLEWESALSAPFIVAPGYGTRCTTVVLIGRDGGVRFVERSFDEAGTPVHEVDVAFAAQQDLRRQPSASPIT